MFKRSIQNSDSGFTLIELLVASSLGLLMLAMAVGTTVSSRHLYEADAIRTNLQQNLRGTMDIIGINIQIAGENLSGTFPAIEIVDGASGAPDELILRRNLHDDVLKVCADLTAGTTDDLFFAVAGTTQGCTYSDNTTKFTSWQAERLAADGQELDVYIYDSATQLGEYFVYNAETDSGTELSINNSSGAWSNDYSKTSGAVYILEEWHLRVNGDILELVMNNDESTVRRVAFGISDFQVQANMENGSTLTEFDADDDWTELKALQVSITASESFQGRETSKTLTSSYFPRNILSN